MRTSTKLRKTSETDIKVSLNIDGTGKSNINTGIGFLDHMLILFSKHGLFDLEVKCEGDLHIDGHHTVEDIGITLGQAFKEAVGDKKGIVRYADTLTPMDECLSLVVLDLGGRAYLALDVEYSRDKVGDFDTELVEEFFRGFVNHCEINLHIKMLSSGNTHHMIESIFKGFGRTLDKATRIDERIEGVMSTKGVI
ncbi:imidazole glycerol phosphate dehydratase HisB [Gottschalkia acidurici 9a]|uniref:Imidazoleglycerol-phosphate dehydratase n=1 Tax=Gottschalkia acidurici (strain ATCC 7906 / DSM 604 / BCRC 14475 / CIP 104303 / KCTC 5404 / NCIMB 10678 / 9a) TaxID=1128398 RepID=K0AYA3_GOTA9|nr:imidazoleglycerol-phosphate dehydratase HisB [Gottschalkia acidurici]AFS78763.1 imidazole glycerol phosphate dehydratase HisB [Gottschalkia acidurici 9a]